MELRLWNLVDYLGNPYSIQGLNKRAALLDLGGELKFIDSLALDPIPLTEEWLLKFGFEWRDGYLLKALNHARMYLGFYAGVSDKMSLLQFEKEELIVMNTICFGANHAEYVHELQNLYFALSGQELTLKETVNA